MAYQPLMPNPVYRSDGALQKALALIAPGMFHYCTREDLIPGLLIGWWFWCVYFNPYILNTLTIFSSCDSVYLVTLSFFLSGNWMLVTAFL